jgi:hypothetical protein
MWDTVAALRVVSIRPEQAHPDGFVKIVTVIAVIKTAPPGYYEIRP